MIAEPEAGRLLRYATLAASSHNTQPWRFELADDCIRVFADAGRQLLVADPDRRELFLSVGCAVENLVVAAEQLGYVATVSYEESEGGIRAADSGCHRASRPHALPAVAGGGGDVSRHRDTPHAARSVRRPARAPRAGAGGVDRGGRARRAAGVRRRRGAKAGGRRRGGRGRTRSVRARRFPARAGGAGRRRRLRNAARVRLDRQGCRQPRRSGATLRGAGARTRRSARRCWDSCSRSRGARRWCAPGARSSASRCSPPPRASRCSRSANPSRSPASEASWPRWSTRRPKRWRCSSGSAAAASRPCATHPGGTRTTSSFTERARARESGLARVVGLADVIESRAARLLLRAVP